MRRPAPWILLAVLSVAGAAIAWHYFPRAFSIVSLDITMDRDHALGEARAIAARLGLGPADHRQASSFVLDDEAQTFVELEGGGKDAFTAMLRDGLYSAYTWRVRHFREGNPNETTIRFTPDGKPYGFVEKLKEDQPGASLDAGTARQRGEAAARADWQVDLSPYALVEQGQEHRIGGRVDHTFTYERSAPQLNEGRYRLRLVVSGDRLTEVTRFIQIPEGFRRRYLNMRSANEAIGLGSAVAMVLLYVVGGIGVGLFFMLRSRWLLWRRAALWGVAVGLAQAVATINQWPLIWIGYDTALPRATFMAQQVALLVVTFIGFSLFFALSFMAAETLTRRAFAAHPQFWRVWEREPGSSTAILGRTVAGFLLVTVFFAYDVLLYAFATKTLGWWSPSEALLQPDVLATYMPWVSAIANSLQAGFWEECLFRAVPIAGAALIGERFGQRKLFIVIAFVVQAIVFGAGHAPYPTQPSYARPVELILPSIGFGLLYLYFGLVPGIVLHYAFDVVWFALPIFIADGNTVSKVMVVLLTFVPLLVVLWRRAQVGRWTELPAAFRNAAWTPPPPVARPAVSAELVHRALPAKLQTAWSALGVLGLVALVAALPLREPAGSLSVSRAEAGDIARRALSERGVTLPPSWRVMPTPDNGEAAPHEFVSETAGEERRRQLVGTYLPAPRWVARVATFEGDVAERAEEWLVMVTGTGEIQRVQHQLPEGRAGATLDETAARNLARHALRDRLSLDAAAGQAREISAKPNKLKGRTDWTFTFVDNTVPPLPKGEPRITVAIAGDEVASVGRTIHVPEEWTRAQTAARTRSLVFQILAGLLFGGVLAGTAVMGVIAWSRGRYSPRLFLATIAIMFVALVASAANTWPTVLATLQTAMPLQIQIIGVISVGLLALTINAALVGLGMGALPHRLARGATLDGREALRLGAALGAFAAGMSLAASTFEPGWRSHPSVGASGAYVPVLEVALDPIATFLMRTVVLLSLFAFVDTATAGWARRRVTWGVLIAAFGLFAAGTPTGLEIWPWLISGALSAIALVAAYATLARADLTMVPIALGTTIALEAVARGAQRAFPGAIAGSLLAAVVVGLLSWWCFRALRGARDAARGVHRSLA